MNNFEELHEIHEYEEYTRSYETRYVAEIRHIGLGTYRLLKDMNERVLHNKIEAQFVTWDSQWERQVIKNKAIAEKEENLKRAEEQTFEAQRVQKEINQILLSSLKQELTFEWESLYDRRQFAKPNPKERLNDELEEIHLPREPLYETLPTEPNREIFKPTISLLDEILTSRKKKKFADKEKVYQKALNEWEKEVIRLQHHNKKLKDEYEEKILEYENAKLLVHKKNEKLEGKWKKEKDDFYKTQERENDKVSKLEERYFKGDASVICQYNELLLNTMQYPEFFPRSFKLEYNEENENLLVEFVLPSPKDIPTLLNVKYIATRKELKETHLTALQLSKLFDKVIYQIALRVVFEIFSRDQIGAIASVIFNGWVETINKATGKDANSCIVSLQTTKEDFFKIELEKVDPKACFKNLKGIGSSKLSGIVAIKPIAQITKHDKRFVESYDVAGNIQEGDNLASMHWEDFEHLIREIFEIEFKSNEGEVKITQASRDGGVDAIAFDPDPIRGGKIVIQAKRYTNTVGVAAVRDLYGTVLNEGATKGILVTTSDYGPDAYQFAKNKPLTLMNGANLLYLLQKHGHKAKIDIAEARRLMR